MNSNGSCNWPVSNPHDLIDIVLCIEAPDTLRLCGIDIPLIGTSLGNLGDCDPSSRPWGLLAVEELLAIS